MWLQGEITGLHFSEVLIFSLSLTAELKTHKTDSLQGTHSLPETLKLSSINLMGPIKHRSDNLYFFQHTKELFIKDLLQLEAVVIGI